MEAAVLEQRVEAAAALEPVLEAAVVEVALEVALELALALALELALELALGAAGTHHSIHRYSRYQQHPLSY